MADSTMTDARDVPAVRIRISREGLAAGAREGGRGPGRLAVSRPPAAVPEESLVVDDRSAVTPARMVESKLEALLRRSSMPMSYLSTKRPVRAGR
ncbi:MAG TPA: hypothetical protein VKP69_04290 [Isosphaeraceae bacterium]|nr:hypothetical protein [Isosphaeraceae bacterium]